VRGEDNGLSECSEDRDVCECNEDNDVCESEDNKGWEGIDNVSFHTLHYPQNRHFFVNFSIVNPNFRPLKINPILGSFYSPFFLIKSLFYGVVFPSLTTNLKATFMHNIHFEKGNDREGKTRKVEIA